MQRQARATGMRQRGLGREHCRNAQCSYLANETRLAVTGATEVHRALCAPERQRVGAYEVAARVVPARNVSGDFVYSVHQADQTFLVLCDLMGKGLSAAMWMTHIADLVHRAAEQSHRVCDLLGNLNTEVLRSRVRAPLTSAVAISVGRSDGAIWCASAGHPPAIIVRHDGSVQTTTAGGPLLGAFPGARYESQNVCLERGESIIAFSDGLIEATRTNHEEFTIEGVMTVAAKEAAAAPSVKISRLLEASAAPMGAHPLDDITILVLERS